MTVYILYPVSETYNGQKQYEVENENKRMYMTVSEINEENGDPQCDHEFKNRGTTDTICHLESCECGQVREVEPMDMLDWLYQYFSIERKE